MSTVQYGVVSVVSLYITCHTNADDQKKKRKEASGTMEQWKDSPGTIYCIKVQPYWASAGDYTKECGIAVLSVWAHGPLART